MGHGEGDPVKLHRILNESWRIGRWNFVAAALLGVVLLINGGGVVRWSYDLFFVVRPDMPVDDVIMVYIDGASLYQIVRHLRRRGETLPIGVTLRIMLDALAGLHDAHELLGPDGAPVKLECSWGRNRWH